VAEPAALVYPKAQGWQGCVLPPGAKVPAGQILQASDGKRPPADMQVSNKTAGTGRFGEQGAQTLGHTWYWLLSGQQQAQHCRHLIMHATCPEPCNTSFLAASYDERFCTEQVLAHAAQLSVEDGSPP